MVNIIVNLSVTGSQIPPVVHTVQGDTGRTLEAHITDMELPSGSTAKFWAVKPSGNGISNAASVSGNVVQVELTNQTLAEVGDIQSQIQIQSGGKLVKTFCFVLRNGKSLAGDYPDSENESDWITEMLDHMQSEVNAAISAAETAASGASTAAGAANQAAQEANQATEAFEEAAEGTIINDTSPSATTVYSSQKTDALLENVLRTSDLVNNLLSGDPDKPLTAQMGKQLDTQKLPRDGDGSEVTVTFSRNTSRVNIVTGETLEEIMGKISKYLYDLKTVAFTGTYTSLTGKPSIVNNATTTASNTILDGRMGKTLQDGIDQNETEISAVKENLQGGSLKIKAGSIVKTATATTAVTVFLNSEINTLLGVSDSTNINTVCHFANGDAGTQSAHLGASYQSSSWKAVADRNFTAGNVRINYIICYWG